MNAIQTEKNTLYIKQRAKDIGFDFCGISKADFLATEAPRLEKWLKEEKHGKMSYMEQHFDKRLDPRLLVEGAKSVVSLLYNYYPPADAKLPEGKNDFKIAKYAYGEDYHFVIKEKLHTLLHHIQQDIGEINGRVFVDSAPVMDKAWAAKSGLGWIGKNTNLIHKKTGSFFFIAELIIDLELLPDAPIADYCGTCQRCVEACPTDALHTPYTIDGSRCISYFTIELKENIPTSVKGQFENWIFGCDICQDVCPWNRFAKPHQTPAFLPSTTLQNFKKEDWTELTEDVFQKVFKKSPLKRAKYEGLRRNIGFIQS
ncbi:MAG: tRNA epoxyqueuosine(34) reductase QueG [Cytophagales bacterium]|nr:MAG: tRNA epoxyqueuosine(34) reductase QueG [Cytophagales bacterium]